MAGGNLIKEARKRGRLSQRELAERIGTTQPVIARWETGRRSPTYDRLLEAVRACGFDLSVRVVQRDLDHEAMIQSNLRLSPRERLDRFALSRAGVEDLTAQVRRRVH